MTSLLPPGPHGGDAYLLACALKVPVDEVLDLSASLNPLAHDPTSILARHLDAIGRYPDDQRATAAVAEVLGVDAKRLVLTNGGAEAIALVAAEHPIGSVDPFEFSLYAHHLAEVDETGRAPRWASDPHNPTGRLADPDDRAQVRDEAFYVLATGPWTRGDPEATVVGSLTKALACPGLRVGYALCPDDRATASLVDRRPRWSLNALAAAAIPDLLAGVDPGAWRDGITALRVELTELLLAHGLQPDDGSANYLWVPHAPGLREDLLVHGVLLRDGKSFGHPDAVRIAVPSADGLQRLSDALEHRSSERARWP